MTHESQPMKPRNAMLAGAGVPPWAIGFSVVLLWAVIFVFSWSPSALGQEPVNEVETTSAEPAAETEPGSDVLDMSLEDLLNVEITSVSKRAEKRIAAPAAIYVLTSEDIRRSGATSIPDALRTVPGIHVAQINAHQWSVTARGFSGRFANKLLVLIDGRSIYTPFFSGVYWEENDVMLEDVDRIEIIRGPGGTLWGANAVNGVINIVTKKAEDTQGGLLSGAAGTENRVNGTLRYGGKVGELGHYRAYAKYFYKDEGGTIIEDENPPFGGKANDDWQNGHAGFRMDLNLSPDDEVTILGGLQLMSANTMHDTFFFTDPFTRRETSHSDLQNYHVLGRWTRTLADDSEIQLQGYWNYYHNSDISLDEQRHILDLDFQHRFAAGARHDILWGLGFRVTTDDFEDTASMSMDPDRATDLLFNAFIQDEITLTDTLRLTLGTKIEHNDYSGIEIQPSARMAWTPNDKHTVWAAVSRAVRTPSRAENDIRIELGELTSFGLPGQFAATFGNDDFDSEEVLSFELGYRTQPHQRLGLDIAMFYNDYDNTRNVEILAPINEDVPAPPHTLVPVLIVNGQGVTAYGFEIGADLSITPWWLVRASYSFINVEGSNLLPTSGAAEVPQNMVSVQNRFDLPHNLEFDTTLRYVDNVPTLDIESYVELDARLAWRPRENLEIAIVGQNLLDSEHEEYDDDVATTVPTRVQRGIYGKITWRF